MVRRPEVIQNIVTLHTYFEGVYPLLKMTLNATIKEYLILFMLHMSLYIFS